MITTLDDGFDQTLLRQAFAQFPSGVTAFCGVVDGEPVGIAASSFTAVSLDPALVSVCIARTSSTWPKLAGLSRVGLSVLGNAHGRVARALASKDADRFREVDWVATPEGAVFVSGSTLWLDCSIFEVLEAGDHQIVLLKVEALDMHRNVSPMVFHGSSFRELCLHQDSA